MSKIVSPFRGYKHSKIEDAADNFYLQQELEVISSEVNRIEYQDLSYMQVFPLVFDNPPPGAKTYSYIDLDYAGMKVGRSYNDDGGTVNVKRTKNPTNICTRTKVYGFDVGDMQRMRLTGQPLDRELAIASRDVLERTVNDLCWNGDDEESIPGFLTNADIPSAAVADGAVGGGTAKTWAAKTTAEIIKDIRTCYQSIITATKGKAGKGRAMAPNAMLLAATHYAELALRPRDTGTDETLLGFLERALQRLSPGFQIISCEELVGSGSGATDEFVLYRRDPRVLGQVYPLPYTEQPPEDEGFMVKIRCHIQHGGVVVRQPLAIARRRGI